MLFSVKLRKTKSGKPGKSSIYTMPFIDKSKNLVLAGNLNETSAKESCKNLYFFGISVRPTLRQSTRTSLS